MADKIQFDIEANDNASSVFRNVSSNVEGFSMTANRNLVRFNNTLRAYNSTMRGFDNVIQRAMVSAGRAVYNFTEDAIKQYAALERQHAKTMGAMAADYGITYAGTVDSVTSQSNYKVFSADSAALKQQALKYGVSGPNGTGSLYDPTQVSAAQTALVKAGVKPADITSTDALQNVMKFAGGNDLALDTAVNFAVQLGTQFKIKPKDWGGMLDQVTYAANASVIDVPDIIESMKYAGNMASGFDQPLSDVLTALALMGNSGLKGSQAGTGVQALFSRSMSTTGLTTAGPPPTDNVKGIYEGFSSQIVDENGNFKGLENYTDVFDSSISTLNDQEKSWFIKKLFGMFQQKAALALGRTDDNGNNLFGEMSDKIVGNSGGTNDTMFQLAMASLGGQLEALSNAYIGFKQGFGEGLAPAVSNISTQLISWLNSNGTYQFNMDTLRQSIYDSGDLIGQKFGTQAEELVDSLGTFLVDSIQISGSELPMIGGTFQGIIKLFNGDFAGAFEEFSTGIDDTNKKIEDLPDNLENTAKGFRNLILAIEGLLALNIVTRVAEGVTSFLRLFSSNKLTFTGNTNVTTPMTYLKAVTANAMIQTMTALVEFMTVYGQVVIVNGATTPGTGTGGSPSTPTTGTPTLPGSTPTAQLPGNTPLTPQLPSGGGSGPVILLPPSSLSGPQINLPPSTGTPPLSLPGTGTNPSLPGDLGGATRNSAVIGVISAIVAFFRKTLPAVLPAVAGIGGNALSLATLKSSGVAGTSSHNPDYDDPTKYTQGFFGVQKVEPKKTPTMFDSSRLSMNGANASTFLLSSMNQRLQAVSNPNLSVKINNKQPLVNVKVNVNVDKTGNTTQNIIKDFGAVDTFFYHASQRTGSTVG
jgi:TP901 family phage tail tape measure protein